MGNHVAVTDATFDAEVRKSAVPVVVDFWAEWCGPCRQIGPALEELAVEYEGKVKIVKVNVDENPDSPAMLGVRGIPALFLFKDGQVVSNKIGAAPKAALANWIKIGDLIAAILRRKGRPRAPFPFRTAFSSAPKYPRGRVLPAPEPRAGFGPATRRDTGPGCARPAASPYCPKTRARNARWRKTGFPAGTARRSWPCGGAARWWSRATGR